MNYKEIYLNFYHKHEGDFICCSVCQQQAVDIHHIQRKGMGGDPTLDRIDNLISLCRDHHTRLGDRKEYKSMLYKILFYDLMKGGFEDFDWIIEQIKKYE